MLVFVDSFVVFAHIFFSGLDNLHFTLDGGTGSGSIPQVLYIILEDSNGNEHHTFYDNFVVNAGVLTSVGNTHGFLGTR